MCIRDRVTITTEAISYNKIFCYRNFYITDETGHQIMLFKTTFALMDYETRKVAEVPDEVVAPYGEMCIRDRTQALISSGKTWKKQKSQKQIKITHCSKTLNH